MTKQLQSLNLRGSPQLRVVVWLWSFSFSDAPEGNKSTGKMSFPEPGEQSEMMWGLAGHWWLKTKLLKVM